ncbi:hypothetical protein HSR122_1512 [Halapricum desulfuricans]|uniref:Uncharacterized protein n=1 Tax=Halapricum desulfuricans TaxID=2841257 RepID=A0A897N8S6_9EURY|nr:hypothetical protein HSR122_1512 [Halapricum desulfuricans]
MYTLCTVWNRCFADSLEQVDVVDRLPVARVETHADPSRSLHPTSSDGERSLSSNLTLADFTV